MTTQILDTRALETRASFIPLSKLSVHERNVRHTDKRVDIEALAASIEAHGLLQNLTVVAREGGRYAVTAGGRRLCALKLLAKQGRIARDYAAPCMLALALSALKAAPAIGSLPPREKTAQLAPFAKMKKAELAAVAAQALSGSGWLPEFLITPLAEGALAITDAGHAVLVDTHAA